VSVARRCFRRRRTDQCLEDGTAAVCSRFRRMALRWLRQHTVTVVFAIVVLLIWALVFYEIFID
jgi:hypothetical protein